MSNEAKIVITADMKSAVSAVKAGVAEIQKSIDSLTVTKKSTRGDADLIAIGEKFKTAKAEAQKLQTTASELAVNLEEKYDKAPETLQRAIDKVIELKSRIEETDDAAEKSTLTAQLGGAKGRLTSLSNKYGYKGLTQDVLQLVDIQDQLKAKQTELNGKVQEFRDREQQVVAVEEKAKQEQQAQADAARTANAEAQNAEATAKAQAEYQKQVGEEIDSNTNKQKQYTDAERVSAEYAKEQAQYKNAQPAQMTFDIDADVAQMTIAQLIRHLGELKARMKEIETAGIPKEQEEEYNKIYNAIYQTNGAIKAYNSSLNDTKGELQEITTSNISFANSFKSFSDAFVSVSNANGLLGKTKALIATLGPTAVTAGVLSKEALTMATAGLNLVIEIVSRLLSLVQSVVSAFKSLASAIISAFKKVIDTLKNVATAIKDNVIKLADKAKSAFGNMFSFSGSDMKRTLQMLTKYIFGVRSFFFLYRKLRKAIGEGIENLVQFESETNKTNEAITEIRTSLLYLKNAWAAAFAPIINVVYPILVKFLNLLASIGNAIARFMAALTGQSTVLQALRVDVGDYADSLNDAAGGAGSAAKAQEELNDRLAAFDDLNVLGVDDDPNKGSGGGGGGGSPEDLLNPNDMFERINTPMNRLADLIRKAWETGDAFQLGALFAERLSESLDKAHAWLTGKGREKILTIANFIGTLIDGVLSNNDLSIKVGQVLADIFDVALTFVNTVITPDRMYMIGLRIAQTLNTAIPQIVPKIGETLGNLFKSAIKGMWGFISNADLAEWGKSFGDAINNFMTQMSGQVGAGGKDTLSGWQLLGMSVTELANQILDFFISAIEEVDWNEISKAIGEFLDSIDWTSVKEKLRTLWDDIWKVLGEVFPDSKGTFDSIRSIFDGVFIVLSKVKDAIAQIDWSPILEGLGTALESVAKMDWAKVGDGISNVIRNLGDNIPELVDGISDIVDGIKDIKDDIIEFVSSKEFFNTVSTIANELERTAEAIQTIIDISANWPLGGLLDIGGKDDSGGILTFFNALASISFDSITQEFGPVISGMIAIRNLFSNFDKFQDDFERFVSFISEHLEKLAGNLDFGATSAIGAFDSLTGGLEDLISDFTDGQISLDEIFGLIVGTFADWDTIKENFINIVNEMVDRIDGFVESFTGIPDALSGLPDRFRSVFNNVIDVINDFFSSVVDGRNELVNVLGSMGGLSGAAAAFASSGAISFNNIPHLAQGAVIPPNNQFLAVLGDQSSGTNIEAPLDTIQQAVGAELAPYLEALIEVNRQVIQAINEKPVISKNDIGKANAQYVAQQKIIRGTML